MNTLDNLQPATVFSYFKKICDIPHGSGNTQMISEYCVNFAKDHGLWYRQDESGNVIIRKPATAGRETDKGIVIQGHLDMVAVKDADSKHDFGKDPLDLVIDGDYLYAKGTSLGGDDGIAIAYALAILDSDTISHPQIEAVFTVDEEIGLLGAAALDMSDVTGSYLLNIDSEEEGVLLVSCAGGLSGYISLPVKRCSCAGTLVKVSVDGLLGGHSGVEIDRERCNAIKLMGRLFFDLHQQFDFKLLSLTGGEKDNAIAKYCEAHLVVYSEKVRELVGVIDNFEKIYLNEYRASDSGLRLDVDIVEDVLDKACVSGVYLEKVIFLLRQLPYGVMHRSVEIEGLVETSMNLGILKMSDDDDELALTVSLRSSENTRKKELNDKVCYLVEFLGGSYSTSGEYPAWPYRSDSEIRPKMTEIYSKMFGKELKVEAIHAGLECGILLEKKPELDAVSFGPDILDIHTAKERLCISSVERMWRYLVEVIEHVL
ncbi:MAG: aminoacyl-histidine dipeptidase [Lachnospiraceae bacterium]|nr:aminoacyl-histidine dipeptidase [Lachnospiraceae bacterium]